MKHAIWFLLPATTAIDRQAFYDGLRRDLDAVHGVAATFGAPPIREQLSEPSCVLAISELTKDQIAPIVKAVDQAASAAVPEVQAFWGSDGCEYAIKELGEYLQNINASKNAQRINIILVPKDSAGIHERIRQDIESRLKILKEEGRSEDLPWIEESERDFWSFMNFWLPMKRPYVFLTDTGNLRAVWKSNDGAQIGLQFRGSDEVSFVLLNDRENSPEHSHSYGLSELKRIPLKIEAQGLMELMDGR